MIGYIEGEIIHFDTQNSTVIIKTTNGIGYQAYYSKFTSLKRAKFFTHQIFRENAQELYAFDTIAEKSFFETLLNVKGVGPKSAYSLISSVGVQEISQAILFENTKVITSAPGIGKKAAAQIILDLKDKLAKNMPVVESTSTTAKTTTNASSVYNESLMACNELGFKDEEVLPLISKFINEEGINSSDEIIKRILQRMG